MVQEYIIRGGKNGGLGLDVLAPKYGGSAKIDVIKKYWDCGFVCSEIPKALLSKYLKYDVYNTWKVYEGQKKALKIDWVSNMCNMNNDLVKVVAEMEYNGLGIDLELDIKIKHKFEKLIKESAIDMYECIAKVHTLPEEVILAGASLMKLVYSLDFHRPNKDLSTKPERDDDVTRCKELRKTWKEYIKRGFRTQSAFKDAVEECFVKLDSGFKVKPIKEVAGANGFSVSSSALEILYKTKLSKKATEFLEAMNNHSKYSHWLSSNWGQIHNGIRDDKKVHGNFNQTGTRTGRFSSSSPNLQNLPSADRNEGMNNIRELIVSRWGDDGCIVAPDFGQLELRWMMDATQSKQGLTDYDTEGFDLHRDNAILFYEGTYNKKWSDLDEHEQKVFRGAQKTINFGLAYGARPKTDLEKSMHKAFMERYHEIGTWHELLDAEVQRYGCFTDACTGFKYNLKGATSANYWRGYDVSGKGWRNKVRNYSIQGGSGRAVQVAMIAVYNEIHARGLQEHIKLVGQVHDELVLDCKKEYLDITMDICNTCMISQLKKDFKKYFKYEIQVDLAIDLEYNVNWFKMKEYTK